ncbi:testis-specific serine/threonine-protein kinase 3-like isoform X4 [Hyposmocoma kahamanoa]|uniref:testis-specific serine/threonine-protein kinase 3-like isoform X4 n=1 Tax=Hyposmocoma kahamanoa TaxID=1477025 RepID=UPI000E6DA26A|nr:testis-specific serine/threonine-protein kinase 3-like isoform X4 [Hyposmocoma kahamanoa]
MPGPDVRANDNVLGEMSTEPTATVHSGVDAKTERKLTVLETHGYVLGRTIGSGSYATVKVATSDRHNCQVAIKIISKFQAPGDYLKKFLPREIEVVKGLKHENLIRFLQAIETTHRVYIVMEYAENGSLLDIIRKDQHIDEMRGRRWFRQLVEAVEYCHERGVVHRDIKCENLLMDHSLNIKLSDFGFARGHMKPKNGVYALSETFCGSYAYASPEILKGVPYRPQDSDIWSMGVVLYAIVYGRLPFDDTNYSQLLKVRVKIPQILADPWLNPNQPVKDEEVDTAQETVQVSKDEIKSVNIGTVTFDRKLEGVK